MLFDTEMYGFVQFQPEENVKTTDPHKNLFLNTHLNNFTKTKK